VKEKIRKILYSADIGFAVKVNTTRI